MSETGPFRTALWWNRTLTNSQELTARQKFRGFRLTTHNVKRKGSRFTAKVAALQRLREKLDEHIAAEPKIENEPLFLIAIWQSFNVRDVARFCDRIANQLVCICHMREVPVRCHNWKISTLVVTLK